MTLEWYPSVKVGNNATAVTDRFTNSYNTAIEFFGYTVYDIDTGNVVNDAIVSCPDTFPVTVNPGAIFPAFNIVFTPTEAKMYRRWVWVEATVPAHDGWNNSTTHVDMFIYGTGVEVPETSMSVQPLSIVFPDTLAGNESAEREILISNTSNASNLAAPVALTSLTCNNQYEISENISVPYTLQAGESLTLHASFKPTTRGDKSTNAGLTIVTDQNNNQAFNVAFVGYAYLTAIAPMSGFDSATLMAFAYGSVGVNNNNSNNNDEVVYIAVKSANSNNLDTEEIQLVDKALMFGEEGIDKTITGLFLKYEDIGIASLAVTVSCRSAKEDVEHSQQKPLVIGSNTADTLPLGAHVNGFTLDAEVLRCRLYKDANTGPMSLITMAYQYLTEQKLVGSLTIPRITDGVGILTAGRLDSTLAAFYNTVFVEGNNNNNNYQQGTAAVGEFNENNFNCEENVSFEKLTAFQLDLVEKSLMRVWVRCEDMGNAVLALSVEGAHSNANNSVAFGSKNATQDIVTVPFDVIISSELLKLKFSQNANNGPLSVVSFITKVEPRGELVGGNQA